MITFIRRNSKFIAAVFCRLIVCALSISATAQEITSPQGQLREGPRQNGTPAGPRYMKDPDSSRVFDDFQSAISLVLNRMISSYAKTIKDPLRMDVMNLSAPGVKQFFSGVTGDPSASDTHSLLMTTYEQNAKFNGKPTGACMLMYNSAEKGLRLYGYESSMLTREDILYYLAAHEFGHCMAFHQASLGGMPTGTPEHMELFADKVAMAFFFVNGKGASAERVVDFNRRMVSSNLHYHPNELQSYYNKLKIKLFTPEQQKQYATMFDVFKLALED